MVTRRTRFYLLRLNPFSSSFDTSPSRAFGRNESHESAWSDSENEFVLLRVHWIIGLPFVDLKSLSTMSNECEGWFVANLVDKLC